MRNKYTNFWRSSKYELYSIYKLIFSLNLGFVQSGAGSWGRTPSIFTGHWKAKGDHNLTTYTGLLVSLISFLQDQFIFLHIHGSKILARNPSKLLCVCVHQNCCASCISSARCKAWLNYFDEGSYISTVGPMSHANMLLLLQQRIIWLLIS
jgi:hypothetical protein